MVLAVSCQHVAVPLVPGLPQVVAHRGASDDAAEHTLAAYRHAIASGADALECDVRLTRDGVLVCVHDRRVDRTSDGHGVVSTLELADLAELDFASWHPSRGEAPDLEHAPDGDEGDRRVLTLERLLETVADCGRRVEIAIETKHPTRYAGLVELTLADLLARFRLDRPDTEGRSPARVMSFASSSLRRLRALAPAVPTVYLMQRVPLRLRDGVPPSPADAVGPSLRALRAVPSYVERSHAHGVPVHVWTVDEPEDVDYVVELGVDVIITNRPAAVRRQLTGQPARA
jgi:glycerophosphoryl diester phosphodiesterase